jgi:uncharacterized metal-binding protein YceD (DUF177 family)
MDTMKAYTIPLKGMGLGEHEYQFHIDNYFLQEFEECPYEAANVSVDLMADKRIDMLLMQFRLDGTVKCNCDRCLASIQLPISGEFDLIVKFDEQLETKLEDDILYLSPEEGHLPLGQVLYDFFMLSIPIVKSYDCNSEDPLPCDKLILAKLEEQEAEELEPQNPIWDQIKDELGLNE